MKRAVAVVCLACLVSPSLFAARPDPINELDLPLKNWIVPSAAPLRIGTNAAISSNASFIAIEVNGYFVEQVITNVTAGAGLAASSSAPGNVTLSIPRLGVTSSMLAGNSVTTGAIQDSAVTAAKIATAQVVKTVNGLTDGVTIAATGGATINTSGSTVTVNTSALAAPSGSMILGAPGDTNLIGAGYTEVGPS